MTEPTPTRDEVARYDPLFSLGEMLKCPDGPYVRFTDYQALRERAEAADRGQTALRSMLRQAEGDLIAARRAEAAAWNDAIEAAAHRCYMDQGRFDSPDRIRALRRAAPTEGEA